MNYTKNLKLYIPNVEDEISVPESLAGNFQMIDDILTAQGDFMAVSISDQMARIEGYFSENDEVMIRFRNEISQAAKEATDKANAAKTISELVQNQFNLIVAEAGTGNPELVQARGGEVNLNTRLDKMAVQLTDAARQTTVLSQGVAVVPSSQNTLADAEIEGRTLVNVSNTNLEAGKKYVLADRKTKVIVDGQTVSGVGKFTKGTTTVTTANFVGKLIGSMVENPHIAFGTTNSIVTELRTPSNKGGMYEFAGAYNSSSKLDGVIHENRLNGNGSIAQHLFSFNVIEQIERTLGKIPGSTVAEKVAWARTNIANYTANWHGFGSSVEGNRANFHVWRHTSSSWVINRTTISPTISRLQIMATAVGEIPTALSSTINSDGFIHFLAYAEPSDGTTPSVINTDFVELVIELSATAQLNTRPKIVRVANFEGKVAGSNVENPHGVKVAGSSTLQIPSSGSFVEFSQLNIERLRATDSLLASHSTTVSNTMAQHLISYNLIEEIERNIGKIPRGTVAEKVAWVKANIGNMSYKWFGFGSSPSGNKATIMAWDNLRNAWTTTTRTHSSNGVALLGGNITWHITLGNLIDNNGFVHLLAHADASDGNIPSVINTDYIELEIELKETADFTNPRVPLYEVTDAEYNKILVDWNADEVARRYPTVQGVQHTQGVGIVAEGENLFDTQATPLEIWQTDLTAIPTEIKMVSKGSSGVNFVRYSVRVVKGATYTLSVSHDNGYFNIIRVNQDGSLSIVQNRKTGIVTFIAETDYYQILFYGGEPISVGRETIFKNPMLTLGSTPKPFVPRNPSSLFADVELGAIGNKADRLYPNNGRRFVRKEIEKDVVLDGSSSWSSAGNFGGVKRVFTATNILGALTSVVGSSVLQKFNGVLQKSDLTAGVSDAHAIFSTGVYLNINNADTGFGESYTPTTNDWKRYFNGWKYTDGTTWTSVTGNGQTATAQQALDTKPSDYTPYKLSYVLANPVTVDVTDKIEGALRLNNGQTQISVDSGYRRTVVDGKSSWAKGSTIDYTVSPVNVKLTYASNIRNAVDDANRKLEDGLTMLSVHERAIVDLYAKIKGLGV